MLKKHPPPRSPQLSTDLQLALSEDELGVVWEALEFAAERGDDFAECFTPWPGIQDKHRLAAVLASLQQIFGWAKAVNVALPCQTVFSEPEVNQRLKIIRD
jgi:hypothetical protein